MKLSFNKLCDVNQVISTSLKNKPNSQMKVSKKILNFFQVLTWSFEVSIVSAISQLPIRVSKLGGGGGGGGGHLP